jgi:tetrahydromethanopterin S-methyltransferase subunit E
MRHAFVFIFLIILLSCQDLEVLEKETINLGATATGTDITSIVVANKSTTIVANTTTGAKYSIQVYPFGGGDPVKTVGFTASSEATIKTINLNDLPVGMYDLHLIDISGTIIKKPLILN